MALSAQVPPSPRRVTGGQGQEARDDGGAPLRSHDRGRGGDLGAAEIASGCECACPDWCAAGAASRDKVTGAHRHLQLLLLAVDLDCVVSLRPLLGMPFPAACASAERKGIMILLEKALCSRAGVAGSCWRACEVGAPVERDGTFTKRWTHAGSDSRRC